MKALHVRRHSLTKKGSARSRGSLLSSDGVSEARRLGASLPSFDSVLTGPNQRHVETAIAMGFAVDEMVEWPSGYVAGVVEHHDQWRWDPPFVRYAELLEHSKSLQEVAQTHLGHWLRAVDQVPEDAAALVISSGGSIEPVLVAASPKFHYASWGSALHHLDGATLMFEGSRCVELLIQRHELWAG